VGFFLNQFSLTFSKLLNVRLNFIFLLKFKNQLMKKIFALLCIIPFFVHGQKSAEKENNFASEKSVLETLKFLTSDENLGRQTGSKEMNNVANYLENIMVGNNVKPYFKTYRDTISNFDLPAYNVVGVVEGNDAVLKKEFIIISAHYDHIGEIEAVDGDNIANGANDNAAGVTAVTEIAKYFGQNKTNKRSLMFVLFTGEEKGLLGSQHLAEKLKAKNFNLYTQLNYEMIGIPMKAKPELLYITGFGKSNMAKKLNEYAQENIVGFLQQELTYKLFMRSDNFSFFKEFNVPCQTVSTFDFENYEYYHHVDDEWDKMNIKHMCNVINKTIPAIEKMANTTTKEIKLN
jgi:hypothetical protein